MRRRRQKRCLYRSIKSHEEHHNGEGRFLPRIRGETLIILAHRNARQQHSPAHDDMTMRHGGEVQAGKNKLGITYRQKLKAFMQVAW